jgi:hypothetical protein
MRLIELLDRLRKTKIPVDIYEDLLTLDIMTVTTEGVSQDLSLSDEMQRAVPAGNIVRVPLSLESQQYLLDHAVPNLINTATDSNYIRTLQSFQAKLNAKLTK